MHTNHRLKGVANRGWGWRAGAVAATLASACAPSAPAEPDVVIEGEPRGEPPSPGAPGIGDSLYPTLGNGGYDVVHYDLDLRYATAAPAQQVVGAVTILARATQALSQFDLDFAGDAVGEVTVDGCVADAHRDGEELVVVPARAVRRGELFVVRVAQFTATPRVPDPELLLGAPLFVAQDGSGWAGQPDAAHRIFPSNDHPRDKASFSFRIDVPEGTTAIANGELVGQRTAHGRTVSRYLQREPMATELAQVAVGAQTVIARGEHHGVIIRDAVPTRLAADLGPQLAIEVAQLDALEAQLGSYPFRSYGSLVVDAGLGFALETQTLSLYASSLFSFPAERYAPVMVHELAHQWFGNSVAPSRWADVWQNEGHATWYELTSQFAPDSPRFLGLALQIYQFSDQLRAVFGPVGSPRSGDVNDVFNPNVYFGGALVLFALRQQVGDPAFQAIERAWVQTYRGRSASTADFIALASRVSGQDLTAFLTDWLYGEVTPAMPGHPDWVSLPPPSAPARAAGAAIALPPELVELSRMQVMRR